MERSPSTTAGTLVDHLEKSARDNPGKIAVKERNRQISYAELDEISDLVAGTLAGRGQDGTMRVGIWLNKSIEAVAAIHAVLRSGGAYVPIDPTAPVRRAATIIADCGMTWLITTTDRVETLRATRPEVLSSLSVLVVGGDPAQAPDDLSVVSWADALARGTRTTRTAAGPDPDDVAYILYTSGSTGTPKGVTLSHGNARAFVDWAGREFGVTSVDVLASHAPLHFDLSVLDVFVAVAAGACVSLVPESWQGLGAALNQFVADEKISMWYSVPSALRRMVEAKNSELLAASRLRVVSFAGEAYSTHHLRALRDKVPTGAALYNLYGPTETNVCTFHRVEDEDFGAAAGAAPPIGQPCPYAGAILLAEDRTRLPGNGEMVGELCISGESVMRGYWNDPAKTASRIVDQTDGRFYRTGDIVRRDRDGRYVFIGRNDSLVKIKGYRVELGEIEAALESSPAVDQAVCVAVGDSASGDTRLAAFVTPLSGVVTDERDMRRQCRESLPSYMVPELIEILPALEYTSTGKVDRLALTALAESRITMRRAGPGAARK
ncbi:amino acid adenylation domain-containing protein [Streptomyces sp. NBC_01267]|uniref:amino acid adenylation domain-containing protein n=1 Tax=unclassified Streptomyces TaxID=2593676 RepID=UPI0020240982|nr:MULTISPECIES: amino acid adenylation domain-containing protein [unclassified Streptomyces]MCX4551218.1 amino acid adenylation domain-containing protein [Streptomyces sp. NBC_01500]WSC22614.1 amino acid adenylation domain-containing protein [Streptomyces sp. NBC_01766]